MSKYILTAEDRGIALSLSESTTRFEIFEHLNGWKSLPEDHCQIDMKEKEVSIAELAYELSMGENYEYRP